MPFDLVLGGRSLEEPGSRVTGEWEDRIAWGMSPGAAGARRAFKIDPNEDVLTVVAKEEWVLAAVADGHWGRQASETAIRAVHKAALAAPETGVELRAVLLAAVREVAALVIVEGAAESSPSIVGLPATALLVALARRGSLELGWMGDCRAFRFASGGNDSLVETDSNWLDAESARVALAEMEGPLLPWAEASFRSSPGEILLLATDGLVEPIYGVEVLTKEELAPWVLPARPVIASCESLIGEALRIDRVHGDDTDRGGEDNVAFILARLP